MSDQLQSSRNRPVGAFIGLARRWRGDRRGTTAIEFGLVALPFFMFVFGIIMASLHHFTTNSLENAVDVAGRKIRTCQVQKNNVTVAQFKDMVHAEASGMIDKAKLRILVQKSADWSTISPQGCVNGSGVMTTSTGSDGELMSNYAGGAGEVVILTACYEWDMPQAFSVFNMGDLPNGSSVLQAATTFRTEPCQ
ncbi:MAG: TadE/TadG family type IV pilus assembly protein [Hyphomicrobiaceae bacterium]|nr:TadE/TadG family type IV pilus assembly protein [Hyphomicrobiaceae bacterium]